MPSMEDVEVNERVTIPGHELWLEFSRSSGPGGQHVNKTSSRATLCWSIDHTGVLEPAQKSRLKNKLRSRVSQEGVLRVSCDRHRSQSANRKEARERLADMVAEALERPKRRIPTKPSRASKERRIQRKKHRGRIKRERRPVKDW
ncbi:MAG: aminoacyl-tRNA hydrolase [Armatimonadia bacterium]|nr:aminoacyl-tRNA hydrolase [Armatimonadia bacterium]